MDEVTKEYIEELAARVEQLEMLLLIEAEERDSAKTDILEQQHQEFVARVRAGRRGVA